MSKNYFKGFLYTIIVFLLLALIVLLWLRYEFAKVSTSDTVIKNFFDVPVRQLKQENITRQPCETSYEFKKAWFGATHVHTSASADARAFGTQVTTADAYSYGSGNSLKIEVEGSDFQPVKIQRNRKLDFMAITDHAEYLGETRLCYDTSSAAYDSLVCSLFRGDTKLPVDDTLQSMVRLFSAVIFGKSRPVRVCGNDNKRCLKEADTAWHKNQIETERWNDSTQNCAFTTFHGYEYTLAEDASNLHRNVIFANSVVPQSIISFKEADKPEKLWSWLNEVCIEGNETCDAISVPHNSNWSSGRMWPKYESNLSIKEKNNLRLRKKLEPLAEIMQVKGDSECRNNISSVLGERDEYCDFEKLRPINEEVLDCGDAMGRDGMLLRGCVSRLSYVRYALTEGLNQYNSLGFNAFEMGIIAATDSHLGAPAADTENGFIGAHGNDFNPKHRLIDQIKVPGNIATGSPIRYNPGGVAGIYAKQNNRESLFSAMRSRETFGTSGPYIEPRFFAGWNLSEDICRTNSFLKRSYAGGVPMGSIIKNIEGKTSSPVFVASAVRDPSEDSTPLQKLQIIKGWIDEQGNAHQRIFDVAGGGMNATVDRTNCSQSGTGYNQLCTTWTDPDFSPNVSGVYYLRVLENPSCRWSQFDCLALDPKTRPKTCSDPSIPSIIQERAWTSPIWYYSKTEEE